MKTQNALIQTILLVTALSYFTSCTDSEIAEAIAEIEKSANSEKVETVIEFDLVAVKMNEDNILSPEVLENCQREEEAMECLLGLGDDVVVNGSFEEGHNLGNNKWNVFAELAGWKVDLDQSDAGIEVQSGMKIAGLAPVDGNSKIELDAHAKNGFSESDTHLYQELSVKKDGLYLITFSYSPRRGALGDSSAVKVFWDGFEIAEVSANKVGWVEYKFIVSASDDLAKIEFAANEDGNTLGGFLDNVSVVEVLN